MGRLWYKVGGGGSKRALLGLDGSTVVFSKGLRALYGRYLAQMGRLRSKVDLCLF